MPATHQLVRVKVLSYNFMAKEKVTLTLDGSQLAELRELVGGRSLSATVDVAVAAHLDKLRHLSAVDQWLDEMERDHGPVPPETLEWAAQLVEQWQATEPKATTESAPGRQRTG